MKIIKAYWENTEFSMDADACKYAGCMKPVRHFVEFEVPDDATDKEIESIARRKDVIIIK